TFRHISDGEPLPNVPTQFNFLKNSEPHNAGEVWASMLFEANVALLKSPAHTFDQARRLMSDYVEGGYQAAPINTSFTEQRDALLATTAATDLKDFALLANAFAKRGAGTCAKSPPMFSMDLTGVVEGFAVQPEVAVVSVKIDDSVKSCDADGILDALETGKVTVTVRNTGMATLANATATVSSSTAGVSFPNGAKVTFAA